MVVLAVSQLRRRPWIRPRRPIRPPELGADVLPPPQPDQLTYRQPYGGRLEPVDLSWN